MSSSALISVIIPVFNATVYLKRCIDSVLGNTYKNIEVICIDDGSFDNSYDILLEYARADSRVIVIQQKNSGTAAARNKGLEAASGAYIAFIDNDDWIHKEYFRYLLDMITRYKADMAVCGFLRTQQLFIKDCEIETSSPKCDVYKGDATIFGPGITESPIWHALYDARLIKGLRFPTTIRIEDFPFALSVVCSKPDIVCCVSKEKLYYYYVHWGSRVETFTLNDQYQLLLYYRMKAEEALKSDDERSAYIYYAHAVKRGVSFRHQCRDYPEQHKIFQIFLEDSICAIKKLSYPTVDKKVYWELLAKYPEIYSTGHVLKNPSILKYKQLCGRLLKKKKKT